MVWVYIGIAVGIAALIVEMGIAYRREASDLRSEQTQVRQHTQRLARRAEEARQKIEAVKVHVEVLKTEKQHLTKELAPQKQWYVEMEAEERTRNPTKFLFKVDAEDTK